MSNEEATTEGKHTSEYANTKFTQVVGVMMIAAGLYFRYSSIDSNDVIIMGVCMVTGMSAFYVRNRTSLKEKKLESAGSPTSVN